MDKALNEKLRALLSEVDMQTLCDNLNEVKKELDAEKLEKEMAAKYKSWFEKPATHYAEIGMKSPPTKRDLCFMLAQQIGATENVINIMTPELLDAFCDNVRTIAKDYTPGSKITVQMSSGSQAWTANKAYSDNSGRINKIINDFLNSL